VRQWLCDRIDGRRDRSAGVATVDRVVYPVSNAAPNDPASFADIKPEDLLRTFDYGDTIHVSDCRERLVNLLADPHHEALSQNTSRG
jgi:hypothetical protein